MESVHESAVMLCTIPSETPLSRLTAFPSELDVFRLEQVFGYFPSLRVLTLHVPEYAAAWLFSRLDRQRLRALVTIERVHVNVMNQNIDFMPPPNMLDDLRSISSVMTMTTAHAQYCTEDLGKRYRMSLHHLAVPIGPDQYRSPSHAEKESLVIFSPDDRDKNREVKRVLEDTIAGLESVEVRGLAYREYRRLLERARWTFTFGEGLDYYFVESVFSGGIAFAVFNDRFFTPEFASLETVYPSFEDLLANIAADVERLSEPAAFDACRRSQLAILGGLFSVERFRANLERFLRGDYTWPYDEPGGAELPTSTAPPE